MRIDAIRCFSYPHQFISELNDIYSQSRINQFHSSHSFPFFFFIIFCYWMEAAHAITRSNGTRYSQISFPAKKFWHFYFLTHSVSHALCMHHIVLVVVVVVERLRNGTLHSIAISNWNYRLSLIGCYERISYFSFSHNTGSWIQSGCAVDHKTFMYVLRLWLWMQNVFFWTRTHRLWYGAMVCDWTASGRQRQSLSFALVQATQLINEATERTNKHKTH